MKKFLLGVAAFLLLTATSASADRDETPMLKMDTTYQIVFGTAFIPMAPFPGRGAETQWALTWEGTVEGDINGVVRWWVPFDLATGSFLGVGRWEFWDCAPEYPVSCDYADTTLLMMAGYDAFGYVSPTDWEGKGVVTYANEQYAEWFGRWISDGGYVDFIPGTEPPVPFSGEGFFEIYADDDDDSDSDSDSD